MERKTARKTAAKTTTPKATPKAKTTTPLAPSTKADARANAKAKTAAKTTPTVAKSRKAKAPAKAPKTVGATTRATGPTPERIALALDVAKRRARGEKWNEIATATGKSEPTLAKLRIDVRNGVFAKVSPAAKRTPASGAGSF